MHKVHVLEHFLSLYPKLPFELQTDRFNSTKYQTTLLHEAAEWNDLPSASLLISLGARINERDQDNATPLVFAISVEMARLLFGAGADLNSRNSDNQHVLHIAASKGLSDLVHFYLEHGVNVRARDRFGYSTLHWSVSPSTNDTPTLHAVLSFVKPRCSGEEFLSFVNERDNVRNIFYV